MSNPNSEQSAYPLPQYADGSERRGMTKREYFSLMILQSLIAAGGEEGLNVVYSAVRQADSLLEALEKK